MLQHGQLRVKRKLEIKHQAGCQEEGGLFRGKVWVPDRTLGCGGWVLWGSGSRADHWATVNTKSLNREEKELNNNIFTVSLSVDQLE